MNNRNERPFPCKDCRFADQEKDKELLAKFQGVDAWCRRNPPTFFPAKDWQLFHLLHCPVRFSGEDDCYSGEPKLRPIDSMEGCKIKVEIDNLQKEIITETLRRFNGDRQAVAKHLGVPRLFIDTKIEEYQIEV